MGRGRECSGLQFSGYEEFYNGLGFGVEGLGFRVEGLGFWGHRYRTLHQEVFLKLSWGSLRRDLELTLDQY